MLTGTADFSGKWSLSGNVAEETFNDLIVRKINTAWPKLYQSITAVKGEVYTFSFFLKSSENAEIQIYTNGTTGKTDLHGARKFNATDEWERYSFIAHVTISGDLNFRPETPTAQEICICGYKLERGENTDTVWTPAPEDYKSIIDRLTALEEAAKAQSAP